MDGTPDISRVINLIMENPELIDGIKSMLSKESSESEKKSAEAETEAVDTSASISEPTVAVKDADSGRSRRNALLRALKPYVSGERAKAIDTMMSIADVMDIIKRG